MFPSGSKGDEGKFDDRIYAIPCISYRRYKYSSILLWHPIFEVVPQTIELVNMCSVTAHKRI